MKYTMSKDKVNEYFGYGKTREVVDEILKRIEDQTDYYKMVDEIAQAIDNELIYTEDQWTIIAEYSSPKDPIYIDCAIEILEEDLINCIVKEKKNEKL